MTVMALLALVSALVAALALAVILGKLHELARRLRQTDAQYRTLVDGIPAVTYVARRSEPGLTYVSPQVEALTGYPARRWVREAPDLWAGLIHPDDRAGVLAARERLDRAGEPLDVEYRLYSRDRRLLWVQEQARALPDDKGRDELVQGVIVDITDVKAGEAARKEKEAHFLATMSHELRTPLNSVLGFTQLLESEQFGALTDRQRRYVENIEASANQLLELINDVLDVSKIRAGEFDVSLAPVIVEPAVEAVIAKMAPLAAAKRIQLTMQVEAGLVVQADPRRLQQVLLNLVSNSIKFTLEGGSVALVCTRAGELARLAVADTGIGIAPADHQRIFHDFTQVDGTLTRQQSGTGLGLPLSRRLVELMGGSLRVQSKLGVGSTFTVELPLVPVSGRGSSRGPRRRPASARA
jgi:PAS domain S-box-containing protein